MESAASVAADVTSIVSESESGIFIIPRRETDTGKLRESIRKQQAAHLARTMQRAYSLDDLRALCFDFGIDYDSIDGDDKRMKIISFVYHFYKNNTLEIITDFLAADRPNYNWRVEGFNSTRVEENEATDDSVSLSGN